MNLDRRINQAQWLVQNVVDRQSHTGVCHAMAIEWLFAQLQGAPWDEDAEYWRAVSHQRAYSIQWEEALNGLWNQANYNRYLATCLAATLNFVKDPALRQRRDFHEDEVYRIDQLSPHIIALGRGSGIVIVLHGSDGRAPAQAQNWGHTVAVVRAADGVYRYIDVNYGQFSWADATSGATVGAEVEHDLASHYEVLGVRNVFIFRVD